MLQLYDINKKESIEGLLEQFKELSNALKDIKYTTPEKVRDTCEELYKTARKLEYKVSAYRIQIENKIDAWLVQLQGEYKKNMLKWTLVISFFTVFSFNADSFSIYQYFNGNPEAQALIETAALEISSPAKTREGDLNRINESLKKGELDRAKFDIQVLANYLVSQFDELNYSKNYSKAETVLKRTAAMDTSDEKAQTFLREQMGELTVLYLALQKESIDLRMAQLDSRSMPLGWGADWKTFSESGYSISLLLVSKKLFGLLLTVFLVSFGAPFWKNIMNALIGLKTIKSNR